MVLAGYDINTGKALYDAIAKRQCEGCCQDPVPPGCDCGGCCNYTNPGVGEVSYLGYNLWLIPSQGHLFKVGEYVCFTTDYWYNGNAYQITAIDTDNITIDTGSHNGPVEIDTTIGLVKPNFVVLTISGVALPDFGPSYGPYCIGDGNQWPNNHICCLVDMEMPNRINGNYLLRPNGSPCAFSQEIDLPDTVVVTSRSHPNSSTMTYYTIDDSIKYFMGDHTITVEATGGSYFLPLFKIDGYCTYNSARMDFQGITTDFSEIFMMYGVGGCGHTLLDLNNVNITVTPYVVPSNACYVLYSKCEVLEPQTQGCITNEQVARAKVYLALASGCQEQTFPENSYVQFQYDVNGVYAGGGSTEIAANGEAILESGCISLYAAEGDKEVTFRITGYSINGQSCESLNELPVNDICTQTLTNCEDADAPTPNPAEIDSVSRLTTDKTYQVIIAVEGESDYGEVEYRFTCDDDSSLDSGWRNVANTEGLTYPGGLTFNGSANQSPECYMVAEPPAVDGYHWRVQYRDAVCLKEGIISDAVEA